MHRLEISSNSDVHVTRHQLGPRTRAKAHFSGNILQHDRISCNLRQFSSFTKKVNITIFVGAKNKIYSICTCRSDYIGLMTALTPLVTKIARFCNSQQGRS